MRCIKCNREVGQGTKFCPECGSSIEVNNEEIKVIGDNFYPIFGICRLVIGILSIVLFFLICFQSCAAGIVNAFEANGSSSGTAGVILAVCWLVAGIVGIAGRKSTGAIGTAAGFYIVGGLLGFFNIGIYEDLAIWSALSIAFAIICILSVVCKRVSAFQKKGISAVVQIVIIFVMLILALTMGDSGEKDSIKSGKDTKESQTTLSNEKQETSEEENDSPEYFVMVADLLKEINDNQINARDKYVGKVVMVQGQISYIGEVDGEYYVSLADPSDEWQLDTVDCYVDKETVSKIKNGDIIKATGMVEDELLGLKLENATIEIVVKEVQEDISSNEATGDSQYTIDTMCGWYTDIEGYGIVVLIEKVDEKSATVYLYPNANINTNPDYVFENCIYSQDDNYLYLRTISGTQDIEVFYDINEVGMIGIGGCEMKTYNSIFSLTNITDIVDLSSDTPVTSDEYMEYYMDKSGSYASRWDSSTASVSMYSTREGAEVGNIELYVADTNAYYSGILVECEPGICSVVTDTGEVINVHFYYDSDVVMDVIINNSCVASLVITEHYYS